MPWFASHGYHCFALSLRGHGRSGGGRKSHFHQHSEDLAGVVETLPATPVVVAHSLGGFFLQRCAAKAAPVMLQPYCLARGGNMHLWLLSSCCQRVWPELSMCNN